MIIKWQTDIFTELSGTQLIVLYQKIHAGQGTACSLQPAAFANLKHIDAFCEDLIDWFYNEKV